MSEDAPASVLTPEQRARRDLFTTACMVLDEPKPGVLFAWGVLDDVGEWRKFEFRQLEWVARQSALEGEAARRFDAFWLLVEEQHARLQAADAAAPPPQPE